MSSGIRTVVPLGAVADRSAPSRPLDALTFLSADPPSRGLAARPAQWTHARAPASPGAGFESRSTDRSAGRRPAASSPNPPVRAPGCRAAPTRRTTNCGGSAEDGPRGTVRAGPRRRRCARRRTTPWRRPPRRLRSGTVRRIVTDPGAKIREMMINPPPGPPPGPEPYDGEQIVRDRRDRRSSRPGPRPGLGRNPSGAPRPPRLRPRHIRAPLVRAPHGRTRGRPPQAVPRRLRPSPGPRVSPGRQGTGVRRAPPRRVPGRGPAFSVRPSCGQVRGGRPVHSFSSRSVSSR